MGVTLLLMTANDIAGETNGTSGVRSHKKVHIRDTICSRHLMDES